LRKTREAILKAIQPVWSIGT